jgi:hypothetical protein
MSFLTRNRNRKKITNNNFICDDSWDMLFLWTILQLRQLWQWRWGTKEIFQKKKKASFHVGEKKSKDHCGFNEYIIYLNINHKTKLTYVLRLFFVCRDKLVFSIWNIFLYLRRHGMALYVDLLELIFEFISSRVVVVDRSHKFYVQMIVVVISHRSL